MPLPPPLPLRVPLRAQVLAALDHLKRTRRKLARFGWLVESCNSAAYDDELLPGSVEEAEVMGSRARATTRHGFGGGGGGGGAEARAAQVQVISCCLILVNAVIGFPDELRARVKLRSEFIRLQLLDVLAALHRERHVDVVRQVEVFENEMQVESMLRPTPSISPHATLPCGPRLGDDMPL